MSPVFKRTTSSTMKKILTVSALAWGLCLSADDWTRFRGSQGTSISSEVNLPVELDAKKHKAWSVDLPAADFRRRLSSATSCF